MTIDTSNCLFPDEHTLAGEVDFNRVILQEMPAILAQIDRIVVTLDKLTNEDQKVPIL